MVHGRIDLPEAPRPPRPKRWTKQEYYRVIKESPAFSQQRLYLFRGEVIEMSPQYHPHAYTVTELTTVLFEIFGVRQGRRVRVQLPFETPGDSVPEPDLAVCTDEQAARHPHPNRAELLIEVADSSLSDDREVALEYAAAGVPEYWIIDVNERRLEVYRSIVADPTTALGFRYVEISHVAENHPIRPLAKPETSFVLAAVLPKLK
ncbi:MAG TPA: Uma2 family endonuclease [Tepidisphaeraceae bacterium]|nr:Uma2 family endonuclease [Tepidisphaeraceae bacterium]